MANTNSCRLRLKCDGTRAETRFRLSSKRTSPFKSTGASVQSTTGSRGVRVSGSNAGYTMFRGSVKGTGYTLHSPASPFTSPPVRHRVPSHFNWTVTHSKLLTLSKDRQSSRRPCVLLSRLSTRLCDRSRVRSDTKPTNSRSGLFTR
jgi:hypothetical protein